MSSEPVIEEISAEHAALVDEHIARHISESGAHGVHWLPFTPDSLSSPPTVSVRALAFPYEQPGWQRWFALMLPTEQVGGHLSLSGYRFDRMIHRCELAMGLEYPYWKQGFGGRLLELAIARATSIPHVEWLDLRVLSCNEPAIALYEKYGFQLISQITDFCRIDGERIDDLFMSLRVGK